MLKDICNSSLIRSKLETALLVFPLIVLMPENALADKANFIVVNGSQTTVQELYVSSSSHETWDDDILGKEVFPSGAKLQLQFEDTSEDDCLYDIRAVFADTQVSETYEVNVCTADAYVLLDKDN